MKRKVRTCPEGCQGSGDFAPPTGTEISPRLPFAALTDDEVLALDRLRQLVLTPPVNPALEEAAWLRARERLYGPRERRGRVRRG